MTKLRGRPRRYQTLMAEVAAASPNKCVLWEVDPGAGKSYAALYAAYEKGLWNRGKPLLIVCSKKALNTWRRELLKWCPDIKEKDLAFVSGTATKRQVLWGKKSFKVYIVTYQSSVRDLQKGAMGPPTRWGMIIADECKILRSRKSKTFKVLGNYFKVASRDGIPIVMMDGTITSRGPQDLWTFLSICDPKNREFTSFWRYINNYVDTVEGVWGKEFLGPKNVVKWQRVIKPYYIRLKDTDELLAQERPELIRDVIPVDMTPQQARMYAELSEEMMALLSDGGAIATPTTISQIMALRKVLVSPKLLDEDVPEWGGAIDHLLLELADDPHCVIFTPFRDGVTTIKKAITCAGLPAPYTLWGGMDMDEVRRVEEEFNSGRGQDKACIITVQFAESYELPTAKQAFFVGYDWSQLVNIQAEKRIHRLGIKETRRVWYYRYPHTVDDQVLMILNAKESSVQIAFKDFLNALLKSNK